MIRTQTVYRLPCPHNQFFILSMSVAFDKMLSICVRASFGIQDRTFNELRGN